MDQFIIEIGPRSQAASSLPFELISIDGRYLVDVPGLKIVREISSRQMPSQRASANPENLRVLHISLGTDPILELRHERAQLLEALAGTPLEFLVTPTPEVLTVELKRFHPTVVHVSSHGYFDILKENHSTASGEEVELRTADLLRQLRDHGVRAVFLASCQSGLFVAGDRQRDPLYSDLEIAGFTFPVQSDTARLMMAAFYGALRQEQDTTEAILSARNANLDDVFSSFSLVHYRPHNSSALRFEATSLPNPRVAVQEFIGSEEVLLRLDGALRIAPRVHVLAPVGFGAKTVLQEWARLQQWNDTVSIDEFTDTQITFHFVNDSEHRIVQIIRWYEAWAILGGERIKLQVFELRSMASGAAYHRAYTHATQQAFLEAHEFAFRYFNGVFRLLRYDNLGSAVKKILRGHQREETSRFIAFRSHWRFQSEFCNPARGNEKGGIEGEGGYFRRNHWVPLPEFLDLEELNTYLEKCCRQDQQRVLSGRTETVGAAMLHEQPHLLPLVAEPFELAETSFPTVDRLRCVRVRTNRYSVPLPPGTKVEARVQADTVELWHRGKRVARHERSFSRQQQILDLEHYLDVLRKKPGALAGSTPLAQWRQAGRWPDCFDRLWQGLISRHGRSQGTRQMIELLSLGVAHDWERLRAAVEQALSLGCHDVAAIRHLLVAGLLTRPAVEAVELGALSRYERPQPVIAGYDQLLTEVGVPGVHVFSHAGVEEVQA